MALAQAEAAAQYLRSHVITALYSSDLPRTLQTAQPIANTTGLTIMEEPALRERNLGIFEGLTRQEVESRYAEDFARYRAREPEFEIPNGESLTQINQRVLTIMETLARRHAGERIAIVSHGALAHHLSAPSPGHPAASCQPLHSAQWQRQPHSIRWGDWKLEPIQFGRKRPSKRHSSSKVNSHEFDASVIPH